MDAHSVDIVLLALGLTFFRPIIAPPLYVHRISFQEASGLRGCQDARELLRYEAVVLEEELHQTLVEVNETQTLLEEGRVQAAER